MNLVENFALAMSGGIIASSLLMSVIGYERSALTRKSASAFSGIGTGVGVAMFIYYGVSKHNLIESILTGSIIAITVGLATFIRNKQK